MRLQRRQVRDFDFSGWAYGTDKSKRDLPIPLEVSPYLLHMVLQRGGFTSVKHIHLKPKLSYRLRFRYDLSYGSIYKHLADYSQNSTDVCPQHPVR
jgi:hypothetical protein